MGRIGPLEFGLILLIILLVFGVGKLPQVGESLGKAIREFRKAQTIYEPGKEKSSAPSALESTKARLAAAEAKIKEMEQTSQNRPTG